jgi:hypothetical protein
VTTVPAIVHAVPPPGAATVPQVPACVAVAPTQLPPQHWVLAVHASLSCLQNDVAALQVPPMQPFEQHSELAAQVLPDALQAPPLVVAQKPPVHLPLQHSLPVVHATAMFLHAVARHWPVAPQEPEQQSELFVHVVAAPVTMHGPERLPHWFGA